MMDHGWGAQAQPAGKLSGGQRLFGQVAQHFQARGVCQGLQRPQHGIGHQFARHQPGFGRPPAEQHQHAGRIQAAIHHQGRGPIGRHQHHFFGIEQGGDLHPLRQGVYQVWELHLPGHGLGLLLGGFEHRQDAPLFLGKKSALVRLQRRQVALAKILWLRPPPQNICQRLWPDGPAALLVMGAQRLHVRLPPLAPLRHVGEALGHIHRHICRQRQGRQAFGWRELLQGP